MAPGTWKARNPQLKGKQLNNGSQSGEGRGSFKLAREDVYVMRSLHKEWGLTNAEIGRRFGVPRETVRDVVRRRSWTHV